MSACLDLLFTQLKHRHEFSKRALGRAGPLGSLWGREKKGDRRGVMLALYGEVRDVRIRE
jgi:hypothetical protein